MNGVAQGVRQCGLGEPLLAADGRGANVDKVRDFGSDQRVEEALEIPGRRIAVLGDMRELGPAETEEHRAVGRRAAETATVIHAVGELGELIAEAARAEGHHDTHHWPTKESAGEAVAADLQEDDVVLLKASRAMEFESLVELLKE